MWEGVKAYQKTLSEGLFYWNMANIPGHEPRFMIARDRFLFKFNFLHIGIILLRN